APPARLALAREQALGLVPVGVELVEVAVLEGLAARAHTLLDDAEAPLEARDGPAQRRLRVHVHVPRWVHDGVEEVADLVGDALRVAALGGLLHLAEPLLDLRDDAVVVGPVEAHPVGALPDAERAQ